MPGAQQPLPAYSVVGLHLSCHAKSIKQYLVLLAAAATSCSIVADSVHDLVLQVKDSQALYRSDFFPGLGWMTTQQVWQGLRWVTLPVAFMWGSGRSLLRLRACGAQVGYSRGCVHVGLRWVTLAAAFM